jgi:predicted nucleic acid-binding protein
VKPQHDSTPTIVLDTNVVLDWLLFADPSCAAIEHCVTAKKVRWIATSAMREELSHVLARGELAAWRPDTAALLGTWERYCRELPPPAPARFDGCLCADADDQKFIDLALSHGARWLVSRDRAVLKLARGMRVHQIEVLKPQDWNFATESVQR